MKRIILCFDDIGQKQETSTGGYAGQQYLAWKTGITNILKLHLMFGGGLGTEQSAYFGNQLSYYYPMADSGTQDDPPVLEVEQIIGQALEDLEAAYQSGDELFVFGLGRGSAIARRLASVLPNRFTADGSPGIRFMGLFDTLASDLVFENQTLAAGVEEALHILALDECRAAFSPTLLNKDPRVMEIWFPGAHEDIGGGYRSDGLADLALQFLLDELIRRDLGLQLLVPSMIDYTGLMDPQTSIDIDFDDLAFQPDHRGQLHGQQLPADSAHERLPVVYQDNRPCDEPPLIHHGVSDRLFDDRDYRPGGLRKRAHRIWFSDEEIQACSGLAEHLLRGVGARQVLQPGESKRMTVHANRPFSRSGILMVKGAEYFFILEGHQTWNDGGVNCGATGWDRDVSTVQMQQSYAGLCDEEKRFPGGRWFEVIGAVGAHEGNLLKVLDHLDSAHPYRASSSDEFFAFPNDLKRCCYNSMGFINITIHRVS
jgi:hypothetical protein